MDNLLGEGELENDEQLFRGCAYHLTELPQEESGDLIAYYQEYFIESDLTLEEIKAQYGTPKQFATKLKLSYFLDQDDYAQEEEKYTCQIRLQLVWLVYGLLPHRFWCLWLLLFFAYSRLINSAIGSPLQPVHA